MVEVDRPVDITSHKQLHSGCCTNGQSHSRWFLKASLSGDDSRGDAVFK